MSAWKNKIFHVTQPLPALPRKQQIFRTFSYVFVQVENSKQRIRVHLFQEAIRKIRNWISEKCVTCRMFHHKNSIQTVWNPTSAKSVRESTPLDSCGKTCRSSAPSNHSTWTSKRTLGPLSYYSRHSGSSVSPWASFDYKYNRFKFQTRFCFLVTYSGDGCNVKIICGRGGAHSLVPLSGVTGISSGSSGLIGQLFGKGNSAWGASFSETNHSNSDALKTLFQNHCTQ